MKIVVIKHDKLYKYPFPSENVDSYWIKDVDDNGSERELISLEKIEDSWFLLSNSTCYLEIAGAKVEKLSLSLNSFYPLKIRDNNDNYSSVLLYIYKENDESYKMYKVLRPGQITIGKSQGQNIVISNEYINDAHAVITKAENGFIVKSVDTKNGIYVNDVRATEKPLENGDIIFIFGYSIIALNDNLLINNYNNKLVINSDNLVENVIPTYFGEKKETVEDDIATLYVENDYYSRQPRFKTSITEENLKIDSPPGKTLPDETPLIMTIGPMITMTMSSAVNVSSTLINLSSGNTTIDRVWPTLLIAGAMVASTLLWPTISRNYQKKKQIKNEAERQRKYSDYLAEKRSKISAIKHDQHQILLENFPEPKYLNNIILSKNRILWQRKTDSEDFLEVRVGLGTIPLRINLSYSVEDFSMSDDNLKDALYNVANTAKEIPNAPVTLSLTAKNKLVLIGEKYYSEAMLKSIMLQLATYHAYDDLKLVYMINDSSDIWETFKMLPHTWSDARDIRFFANNYDDMTKISYYLEQVFISRKNAATENNNDVSFRNFKPYYLIVVDNIKKNKNVEIISKILKEPLNLGFGVIILNDGISNLPNECNNFLTADAKNCAIVTNDLNKNKQQSFVMDKFEDINLPLLFEKLSNIPIKSDLVFENFSKSIGFLEMCKVGKVEQLNVLDRWVKSDPVNSLSVPLGIRGDGELFTLDLHEKFHGPHGLIAGMTGSGKSEFIITFILSMCLNFSPEEVSFVLIDYKGGGLTGAFENKMTGVKLPHLAGTITNLDKAEINRALASIQSELKRRQELFNQAKVKLNESTLDIYKYQQMYRDGKIDEPVSHLFIISDEFAELKSQQSSFMQELISTARIGRSLGVHLILATQKPSGIVDDQIWSNSKFKICLKVQERADSMDVIKCPDAVTLKNPGRFYLQVGYNDYFAMGQAAYAGTKYIPKDKLARTVNRNVSFINNIGDTYRNIETVHIAEGTSLGEELPNILKYICDAAATKNLVARKLWLDKIPSEIFVTNLIRKYSFVPKPWEITAVVGEYDDPNNQKQGLLTIDFNDTGNTLVYGSIGKEIMLSSIIYSLIINHTSDELNIYILDFGNEMFGSFEAAPQVGDVIFINEDEKIVNLFATVAKELEIRKKLFSDYNGSYNIFIKNSGKTLPRIIIMISNYEMLSETYEDFVGIIASLSREGEKYGIYFVISATGANAVRGKTTQNFSNTLCLQFNDDGDYSTVLGPVRGLIPSAIDGRGLVKLDGNIYEYQTAYPYKWDEINVFIKNICAQLSEKVKKQAKAIAILPNHVRMENVEKKITDLKNVPVGIVKSSLEVSTFNFYKTPISLVSCQDVSLLDRFIPSLGQVIQKIDGVELHMIDASETIRDTKTFNNYYSVNSKDIIEQIDKMKEDTSKTHVILILSVESFMNALSKEEQKSVKDKFATLKSTPNIRVIISDAVNKIKPLEYDEFYRSCVQPINAVWVGSGITDQFTIKSSTYNKQTRSQIPADFGYNVDRGNAKFIKVLDFYTRD